VRLPTFKDLCPANIIRVGAARARIIPAVATVHFQQLDRRLGIRRSACWAGAHRTQIYTMLRLDTVRVKQYLAFLQSHHSIYSSNNSKVALLGWALRQALARAYRAKWEDR
jgi:hypothetical protein